jgi:hypothetical protein
MSGVHQANIHGSIGYERLNARTTPATTIMHEYYNVKLADLVKMIDVVPELSGLSAVEKVHWRKELIRAICRCNVRWVLQNELRKNPFHQAMATTVKPDIPYTPQSNRPTIHPFSACNTDALHRHPATPIPIDLPYHGAPLHSAYATPAPISRHPLPPGSASGHLLHPLPLGSVSGPSNPSLPPGRVCDPSYLSPTTPPGAQGRYGRPPPPSGVSGRQVSFSSPIGVGSGGMSQSSPNVGPTDIVMRIPASLATGQVGAPRASSSLSDDLKYGGPSLLNVEQRDRADRVVASGVARPPVQEVESLSSGTVAGDGGVHSPHIDPNDLQLRSRRPMPAHRTRNAEYGERRERQTTSGPVSDMLVDDRRHSNETFFDNDQGVLCDQTYDEEDNPFGGGGHGPSLSPPDDESCSL